MDGKLGSRVRCAEDSGQVNSNQGEGIGQGEDDAGVDELKVSGRKMLENTCAIYLIHLRVMT